MQIKRLSDIHLRDPFVLTDKNEKKYYLYGTLGVNVWEGPAIGFDVYVSSDLQEWTGPIPAFRPEPDFWADHHFWAPEVYLWGGRYYMFASFKVEGRCRGTGILTAESPEGPFHSMGLPLTPPDWECLDGTLFVDENGAPWMVFCREWLQVEDGEMYAIRLQEDLTGTVGEPVLLFRASEAPWTTGFGESGENYVTDGPFLYRLPSGELIMLWSSHGDLGYALGIARSQSGQIAGPWTHDPLPLFAKDGGHGMLFQTFSGQSMLTIHAPNDAPNERPVLFRAVEDGGRLTIEKRD
ncbi:glycoside hydrolase family 43 protein [Paenibacillus prosopidis]|uniref:Glycosyl hydrolase family 43 n=1 Tax=Paenibacillus prosopidis TaxID=630520 RepID=A0A368W3E6_9BACL|nr:glycoside hydrolase family 43 protein [Paenibacillus prosopidis]RCW48486.1 glycosyl hydrolase family 43 [Paenibacillus prosopidis]